MNTRKPVSPPPSQSPLKKSPPLRHRSDGYQSFMSLYGLSDDELERRIMAMDEDEFAAFSEWHDTRLRDQLRRARRKLPKQVQDELWAARCRNTEPRRSRIENLPIDRGMLAVLDYLSGHHPLICHTQEDRDDLATTRAVADIFIEVMADIGVKDRHEAAIVLESIFATQAKRKQEARKAHASRTTTTRTHRNKP